ncbi:DUF485 domain-containing protein [Adhaeribacter arboris]|uniref:DUF485 domain-containing protein n=1 Tax=Adhaeribacter arboris TaxID=2072846 RepID=A0A2T2YA96_9BACT|nr:DUF485 domain-containing protein [Adhaeribacter arboris]PSR52406.1 DUF485 domain-containing protein [Adhaeribacter arboris]
MHPPHKTARAVIESPEFKRLVSKRWSVSLLLTISILVIYIGFLLVVAFDKELLAVKIGSYLPWALPIGFGIIVSAWLLTGIYVYWANNTYDTEVQEIKNKMNAN